MTHAKVINVGFNIVFNAKKCLRNIHVSGSVTLTMLKSLIEYVLDRN